MGPGRQRRSQQPSDEDAGRPARPWVADLPQSLVALAGGRECPVLGAVQAPSGSTIRRVLTLVDADAADRVVGLWLASLMGSAGEGLRGLAMDAKTVCNASTVDGAVTLFAAMAHERAVVLGQVRVPVGTTETTLWGAKTLARSLSRGKW